MRALHSSSTRAHTHGRTHAKHRLAAVTHWPSNRCREQCESRATPALLCCSTSSLVQGPTYRPREFLPPSPLPSQATSRPGPLPNHAPPPPNNLFFSTWFPHRGQAIESFTKNTHIHTHTHVFFSSQKYPCMQIRSFSFTSDQPVNSRASKIKC